MRAFIRGKINNTFITGNCGVTGITAIYIDRGGSSPNQILNNTILNYKRNGIHINRTGSTASNTIVQGNYAGCEGGSLRGGGQSGIRVSNSAGGDINNNRISEAITSCRLLYQFD